MTQRVRRLNVGCGPCVLAGWINVDQQPLDHIDMASDLRSGLALQSDSIDYIVGIHVLQDLPFLDIPPALTELKRVLKPNGLMRLALPDLDWAIRAYLTGDHDYFYVPKTDAQHIGTKLVMQIVWYGSVRTPMTFDGTHEFLANQRFGHISRCPFGHPTGPYREITSLDTRPRESLFMEATKEARP